MAERTNWQQNGRLLRQTTRSPERLGQFIQPKSNGNTEHAESPSSGLAPSASHGSSFVSNLRPLAPQRSSGNRPPSHRSVRIPPIRRMAPQHDIAKRPAWQEPILQPPPPSSRQTRQRAFLTSQTSLIPLILGRPEEEWEQLVARPRNITFLPPLTGPPHSSRNSLVKQQSPVLLPSPEIPSPTPPKADGPIHQPGLAGTSSALIPPATTPRFNDYFQSPSIPASMYTSIPPAAPVHPQLQMGPQSPFRALAPHITPSKPLPQLPLMSPSKFFSRLPQSSDTAEHHTRQYRPRTPPPSSFVSQSQMAAACRSASLPALPSFGEKSWATHYLTVKYFQSSPVNKAKDAAIEDALTPVKFVDYTQIATFHYTKFPNTAASTLNKDHCIEPATPFGPHQARVFVLKLLPTMQYLKENRIATPAETLVYAELARVAEDWLLTTEVSHWPNLAGAHYGMLLFHQAKCLNDNWFVVSALPHFLWSKWTLPCTEIQGRSLSWEWYLMIQDVFFKSALEAYTELLRENYVIVGDTAYPMNTIVPRVTAPAGYGGFFNSAGVD